MTTTPTELEERVIRIAGRAQVGQSLVVSALLGAAGIDSTLVAANAEQMGRVLEMARQWDDDDVDANDPGPYQLHLHAERWRELRGGQR